MKKLIGLIILCTLSLGSNAYSHELPMPNFSDIESIKLHNGKSIDVNKEVKYIQFAFDRENKVDYVELIEGSIIDSYDIKKIILKKSSVNPTSDDILRSYRIDSNFILARVLGDGSGG